MPTLDAPSTPPKSHSSLFTAWLPLAIVPFAAVFVRDRLPPWAFMWCLAISIYATLKWASWWRSPLRDSAPSSRSVGYLIAWPGMDADSFLDVNRRVPPLPAKRWAWAFAKTLIGALLLWIVPRRIPPSQPLLRAWTGLLGMVLLAHFGSFQVVALLWQNHGVDAVPIMNSPWRSTSLSEFWGKRWNLGFRQLGHDLIFQPLHARIGAATSSFLVFVASGLIHDFVISFPARGGYGWPTGYFLLQGIGVALERSRIGKRFRLRHGAPGWIFTALCTAGPAFWLFHPPFLRIVVLPFMQVIHAL